MERDATLNPATKIPDEPLERTLHGKLWSPKNSDGQFRGEVTLREAIEKSRNVPAVHLSEWVGLANTQRDLKRFGFSRATHLPSVALGAFSTTPLEAAKAYTVFATNGILREPELIHAVVRGQDQVLWQNNRQSTQVLSKRATQLTHSILEGVMLDGTARTAPQYGITKNAAGKTGTTNELVDAWFAGFNPDIVTVTWMGFDQPRTLGKHESGARAALPIWIDYMRPIINEYPTKILESPYGIVPLRINPKDGMLAKKGEDGIFEYFYDEFLPTKNAYFLLN